MADREIGTLTITMAAKEHSSADLASLSDMIEGLVMAGVWGEIAFGKSDLARRAQEILKAFAGPKEWSPRSFLPYPFRTPLGDEWAMSPDTYNQRNAHARRFIMRKSPSTYRELFSFVQIRRLEHHSPLLIELAILSGPLLVAPLLVLAWSRVASDMRRHAASADIDEALARTKKAEAGQAESKDKIMDYMAQSAAKQLSENKLEVPKEVLHEAAKAAFAPVVDLSGSDLLQDALAAVSKKDGPSKGDEKEEKKRKS
jgi:hypothetical protein